MKSFILSVCVLLVVALPVAAAQDDIESATKELQSYLDNTKTLAADFDSVLLDAGQREIATSNGEVFIKRPGKFRWQYRTPSPSLILADGVELWSFDEELEQAVVRKMSDYRGANPTLLLGGEANVTDGFEVQGIYQTEDIRWLELKPRDDSSDFVKVRLGFKNEVITLMELFDRLEQTTRIRFHNIKTNTDIADELFVFEPADNIDVIGRD